MKSEFKGIASGPYHTFFSTIKKGEIKVYASGKNNYGQLGLGDYINRNKLTELPNFVEKYGIPLKIIVGVCHTFFITIKNNKKFVYSCGENHNGELGLGDTFNRNTLTKIKKFGQYYGEIIDIMCDHACTFFITNNNCKISLYTCGNNIVKRHNKCILTEVPDFVENYGYPFNIFNDHNFICYTTNKNGKNHVYIYDSNQRYNKSYEVPNFDENREKLLNVYYHGHCMFVITNKNEHICVYVYFLNMPFSKHSFNKMLELDNFSDKYGDGSNSELIDIICDDYHVFFIVTTKNTKKIYIYGDNYGGELGCSSYKSRDNLFELVDFYNKYGELQNIITFENSTFFITCKNNKSHIYVCGNNCSGQLDSTIKSPIRDLTEINKFYENYGDLFFYNNIMKIKSALSCNF